MTPEQLKDILYNLITNQSCALERGAKDRERIAQSLARGERPTGRRVDWLKETASAINQAILKKTAEFNERYPGDRISVLDILDALSTLAASYRKISKKDR